MNSMNYKTLEKLGRAVLYGNILSSIHTDAQAKVQFDMALEMFKKYIGNVYDGTLPDPTAEGDECLLRVDNEYTPYKVVEGVWKKYTTAEGTTTEADLTDYYTKAETRDYVDDKTSDCAHKTGDNTFSGSNTFTGTLTATLTGNADTATKATKDSEGNVIKDTYATKTECSSKATLDATQMLAVNSGITATKVSEYEALKTSKANDSELSTVAKSGSYSDLLNKPTINDSTINVKVNGTSVGTFTTNNATSKDIAITVPTKMSDLDNDSDYIASPTLHDYALKTEVNAKQNALTDTQLSAVNSGITSDKVATYDGYATSKANDSSVVHTSGDETIGGTKTFSGVIVGSGNLNIQGGGNWDAGARLTLNQKTESMSVILQTFSSTDSSAYIYDVTNFYPYANNKSNLGTSSSKWKTFNGVNPGALSLPTWNDGIYSVKGYITDLTGNDWNEIPNTLNSAWIYIQTSNTQFISIGTGNKFYTQNNLNGTIFSIFLPTTYNISIKVKCSSVDICELLPTFGN